MKKKFYCKVVFKDKIEPTIYFQDIDECGIMDKFRELMVEFIDKDDISGIFFGKKEQPS